MWAQGCWDRGTGRRRIKGGGNESPDTDTRRPTGSSIPPKAHTRHLTPHTSHPHLTPQPHTHLTPHIAHLTPHTSPTHPTPEISHLTPHTSHLSPTPHPPTGSSIPTPYTTIHTTQPPKIHTHVRHTVHMPKSITILTHTSASTWIGAPAFQSEPDYEELQMEP